MIHLSAIDASRLLGNNPKAKAVVNKVKKAQQVDTLHQRVLAQLVGFPDPATELLFHPKRKWRFDYAWEEQKLALEVHGGIHSGGRALTGTWIETAPFFTANGGQGVVPSRARGLKLRSARDRPLRQGSSCPHGHVD